MEPSTLPEITIELQPEIPLTPRQREVACMLACGKTNREIAAILGASTKTIDTHRGAALKRLGARNNADLTRYAIAAGLITVDGEIVVRLEPAFDTATITMRPLDEIVAGPNQDEVTELRYLTTVRDRQHGRADETAAVLGCTPAQLREFTASARSRGLLSDHRADWNGITTLGYMRIAELGARLQIVTTTSALEG